MLTALDFQVSSLHSSTIIHTPLYHFTLYSSSAHTRLPPFFSHYLFPVYYLPLVFSFYYHTITCYRHLYR
ncbi:hypothetical protein BJ508DRAFT_3063 [Ascobolus immersus RN42]|uniref:Uncharacterized protein n=1 Tax=Ascobolus immersus RN42 TaxID=1160509 RepID=A0A3N4IPP2_ASCIM|nr:hypothetical protein BJ508DRAFT_3063 [Ascobolus immersus RN42]